MRCSASGSMRWRYRAWWPAPPRCFWSTDAPEPDEDLETKASGLSPEGLCGIRANYCRNIFLKQTSFRFAGKCSQRFDFLAFFAAFLAAFLTVFFAAFLADFFAEDFFEAFLAFLAFFGITFLATFLAF